MLIAGNGNVGIGVMNPTEDLHVAGRARIGLIPVNLTFAGNYLSVITTSDGVLQSIQVAKDFGTLSSGQNTTIEITRGVVHIAFTSNVGATIVFDEFVGAANPYAISGINEKGGTLNTSTSSSGSIRTMTLTRSGTSETVTLSYNTTSNILTITSTNITSKFYIDGRNYLGFKKFCARKNT